VEKRDGFGTVFFEIPSVHQGKILMHPIFQLVGLAGPQKLNIVLKTIGLGDAELSHSWPKTPFIHNRGEGVKGHENSSQEARK
jgi:hypothetical protein